MVVGRSDALTLVQVWAPNGIKPSQPLGTGWTDGVKRGIGAFNVLCSKDDVKCPGAKSSAPEEPVPTEAKHRSNDCSKSNGYVMVQRDRFNRCLVTGLTDGYCVSSRLCVRRPTAISGLRVTGWTDATPCRGVGSTGGLLFSANRWSNSSKTWWPIYTPHPGHLKLCWSC